jgi:CheY-like chemotaxis protein/HPt (histidine-containing phosphotransfer) domain-containing protein
LNLLTNAVKYTEAGSVSLDVSFEKTGEEEISMKVWVADTGIGMKPEDIEKLFVPYTRIEEERNRTIEGTGLGMSIVRQLLELMGSQLRVESTYGEGSFFFFEIRQKVLNWAPMGDAARFSTEAEEPVEYHELFHAPEGRILVVDDTEVNLTVIRNLLKRTRIQVDTALSGKEALVATEKNPYDIVFIDHMMPEMDGIETLGHMKEQRTGEATVYVALTANAISGAREMYLEEGFHDYMSKPVEGAKLEEMIRKYLPQEKLLPVSEEDLPEEADPAGAATEPEAALPDWLYRVEDLDPEVGIENCGSEDSYLLVLEVFHKTADPNAEEIAGYLRDGDIENYTVKVHALKSSARIIGAAKLSELARQLEESGKSGDVERIRRDTDCLLEMYRELDQSLKKLDPAEEELKELADSMRKEAFQTVSEIAEIMDYGMMEGILKDLRGYRLTKEDADAVSKMENCLLQLDWEGIRAALREVL